MSKASSKVTNYEINKQAYSSEKFTVDEDKIKKELEFLSKGVEYTNGTYIGLLCRERHDYTVFHFNSNDIEEFVKELKEVINSRGQLVDIKYERNTFGETYQLWMREKRTDAIDDLENAFDNYKWTPQVGMYVLFDATDWVIEIGE